MDTYCEALDEVLNTLKDNFVKSKSEKIQQTNSFLNLVDLLGQTYDSIPPAPAKAVFDEVRSDLLNSLIFCFQGYYRHSNICLRSSLELTLSYLYYTDNQYDFILFLNIFQVNLLRKQSNEKFSISNTQATKSDRNPVKQGFGNLEKFSKR